MITAVPANICSVSSPAGLRGCRADCSGAALGKSAHGTESEEVYMCTWQCLL